MLLLPLDRAFDWKRPPLITVALVLINLIIYATLQTGDQQATVDAYNYYFVQSHLPKVEFARYVDFLRAHGQSDAANDVEKRVNSGEAQALGPILTAIEGDARFLAELHGPNTDASAADERSEFEQILNRSKAQHWGFKPGQPTWASAFAQMFLHGSWGHVIGNMVILVLVGYAIESVAGGPALLFAYLATGLGAAGFDMLVHPHSAIPTVGASGAIAGLMGTYAAIYGRRDIRFFYWIGPYFDYIRAPALWLLPAWVFMELLQLKLNPTSNVAHMLHVGGFLSGAAIGTLLRRGNAEKTLAADDAASAWKVLYGDAQQALRQLDFVKAQRLMRAVLQQRPDDLLVLRQYYNVCKLTQSADEFHWAGVRLLSQGRALEGDDFLDLFNAYISGPLPAAPIDEPELTPMVRAFAYHRQLDRLADWAAAPGSEARVVVPALSQAIAVARVQMA